MNPIKKARMEKNSVLIKRSSKVMLPGSQNYLNMLTLGEYPRYFVKAKGPYVWDVDENKYVDLFLGSGAIILGHGNSVQLKSVRSQLRSGASVSMRHPAEVDVAECLLDLMPFGQYVAFFKTGSEATHAATRIACSVTKRSTVVSLGYHGWLPPFENVFNDNALAIKAEWNEQYLEDIFEKKGEEICATIISPCPQQLSSKFYHFAENLVKRNGSLFIMDEIKTGFRLNFPSFCSSIGLKPDILLLGKALSNGFPLAAMICKQEVKERCDFNYFSTFAGEPLSLVASRETLRMLMNGEYKKFERNSTILHNALSDALRRTKISTVGKPTFFRLEYPQSEYGDSFCKILAEKGVLLHPRDELLISSAHNEAVIHRVLEGIIEATIIMGG